MGKTLERIAFGIMSLAGLVVLSDGIEIARATAQNSMEKASYAEGIAMAIAGLCAAGYAGYLVVKSIYQEYKGQDKD